MLKSKLIKLKSLQHDQQFLIVKEGEVVEGTFSSWPTIGDRFMFIAYNNPIWTSAVQEIIDDRTFKTKNSIYKIVTIDDERDNKIQIIFE